MINLNLNLDHTQHAQFSSLEALRKAVLANEARYDGLCLFADPQDEMPIVELTYTECYDEWEVCNDGGEAFAHGTINETVDAFIQELSDLGVW